MKASTQRRQPERDASERNFSELPGPFLGTRNPRQLRVIQALMRGACTRHDIDRIAGASNGPEVIAMLRRLGLTIPCEREPAIDRDGARVSSGLYRFTSLDHRKIRQWQSRHRV